MEHSTMSRPFALAGKSLPLLVKPASSLCNLRCSHCFYTAKRLHPALNQGKMSADTLKKLIRSYLALPLAEHTFIWQGGEPTLMGHSFYSSVVRLQKQYAQGSAPVHNCLQTNGTLMTPVFAKFLAQHNFLVGISVDGEERHHNAYRIFPSRKGSYATVLQHVNLLQKHKASLNALTLATSNNVADMGRIFLHLLQKGFLFQQYIPCIEYGQDGKPLPWTISAAQWGLALCQLFDVWWEHRFTVSVRYFDALLHALVYGEAGICHAGKHCDQYLVVEHDGQVFPCDFFTAPAWSLGNIRKDSWQQILENPLRQQFALQKSPAHACMACPYLHLCGGDCQKHRIQQEQPSVLCQAYKQFFAHALPKMTILADLVRKHPPSFLA